ncbi:unnamed protein product [Moneuplotes crassus]|uniref:Uncharacterized protein n=1 Tax=Euplotes crassus TaxID=5936 RepID=A0AAD2D2U1_EUPCR|nr:unnamed protein product [Moneuplotes crassus]
MNPKLQVCIPEPEGFRNQDLLNLDQLKDFYLFRTHTEVIKESEILAKEFRNFCKHRKLSQSDKKRHERIKFMKKKYYFMSHSGISARHYY